MTLFNKLTPTLGATAAALILAAGAAAQPDRRPPGPPPPPPSQRGDGELRGPQVRDDHAPGTAEGFVRGGNQNRMGMGDRIPPRVFLDALRSLGDDKLPDGVRATPEQMDKLTALSEAFRAQRDAYMKQHEGEMRDLRKDAGRGPGQGGPRPEGRGEGRPDGRGEGRPEGRGGDRRGPDAPPPPPPPPPRGDAMNDDAPPVDPAKREQARARIREIEAGAPKIEDVYTKAWAELNDAQKKHVEGRLAEFRERGAKDREDSYVRQRVGERAAKAAAGGPPPPPPPGADGPRAGATDERSLRERRERLMRAFEQLPPEEQDRILSRLEQRLADRGRDGGGSGRGPEAGDRRPPPPPPGQEDERPRRRRGPGADSPPPPPPAPSRGE